MTCEVLRRLGLPQPMEVLAMRAAWREVEDARQAALERLEWRRADPA